jgi:hypothetical protein
MAGTARVMGIIGTLIGLGAAGVLLWNEWQLARAFGALAAAGEGLAATEAGDGGPVHVVGEATATAPVRDPVLGVAADALRLDRTAETYQWLEHKEGTGDNKTLRYERVWSPLLIPSGRFEQRAHHANPPALRLESGQFPAADARLGRLLLDEALVAALPASRELLPDRERPVAGQGLSFERSGDWLYSGDPASPAIGDVRLRLAVAPEGTVSVVAARDLDRLVPWQAPNGEAVALAAYGEVPAEELLRRAARGDWQEAWTLRGFGALVMLVAAIFATPALTERFRGQPALHGRRRLATMVMLAAGLSAAVCAAGWIGSRLALGLGMLAG